MDCWDCDQLKPKEGSWLDKSTFYHFYLFKCISQQRDAQLTSFYWLPHLKGMYWIANLWKCVYLTLYCTTDPWNGWFFFTGHWAVGSVGRYLQQFTTFCNKTFWKRNDWLSLNVSQYVYTKCASIYLQLNPENCINWLVGPTVSFLCDVRVCSWCVAVDEA